VWIEKYPLLSKCSLDWRPSADCGFKPEGNFEQFRIVTCLRTPLMRITDFIREPNVAVAIATLLESELGLRGTDEVVECTHKVSSLLIHELVLVGNSVQGDFVRILRRFRGSKWHNTVIRGSSDPDITEVFMLFNDSRVLFLFLIPKGDVDLEIE
jgi:hypothetical protein